MSGFNETSPPPSYTLEPSDGEIIIDDNLLIGNANASSENEKKESIPSEILMPENLNSVYNQPDRYFWTPASTPYATAFNTPNPGLPEKIPIGSFPSDMQGQYFNFQPNLMNPQGYMMNGYGVPLQPVAGSAISQQPINVVVNASSSVNGGESARYCPKCRVGVIVRKQSRMRQIAIVMMSAITCCLCCTCCYLLKNNYVDKCSYCGKNYGHRGARYEKIKRSTNCLCCC
ncbi:unnamed protein product [Auanema sp. JU1783]|nr:unnamed protein product [Auanema sp. JU1783]